MAVKYERAVLVLQRSLSTGPAQYAQRADGAWFSRVAEWRRGKWTWCPWLYDRAPGKWIPGKPVDAVVLVPSQWKGQLPQIFEFNPPG
jgi:hypothetical protein